MGEQPAAHGCWQRVPQLQTGRSPLQHGTNTSEAMSELLQQQRCVALPGPFRTPPASLLGADLEAWSETPRQQDRNNSCLGISRTATSPLWNTAFWSSAPPRDHQGSREDAFKTNFSPFLFGCPVMVLSFSNKLPELGKFTVQAEVAILEGRWKEKGLPCAREVLFPTEDRIPKPRTHRGRKVWGTEKRKISIAEGADHDLGTARRQQRTSSGYSAKIPLWCGASMEPKLHLLSLSRI